MRKIIHKNKKSYQNGIRKENNMTSRLAFNEMESEIEEITRQQLGCYKCMYFRECEYPCKGGTGL